MNRKIIFRNADEVNSYLNRIPKFQDKGSKAAHFQLAGIRNFCGSIGNPEQDFPSIHVAGTNGKGTTCRLIASVYQSAGYKTGLYTSPHIMHFNERFKINSSEIGDDALLSFFNLYGDKLQNAGLTYFEICTALAFWWFSREDVDIAIIETGLGGRLDATNIITPEVSVITSVAKDHTDILGSDLASIAGEKAGIIKKNVPVVIGKLAEVAKKVILNNAQKKKSVVYGIDEPEVRYKSSRIEINSGQEQEINLNNPFKAPVNLYNLAVTWRVINLLGSKFSVSNKALKEGIANVQKRFIHTGNFEKLHPGLDWYFDGAHNIEAVEALMQTVRTIKSPNDAVLILSMMKDKVNKPVLNAFSEFKKKYYYTLGADRAATLQDIQHGMEHILPFPANPEDIKAKLCALKSELVIFAGSFYFYSIVRKWLTAIDLDY